MTKSMATDKESKCVKHSKILSIKPEDVSNRVLVVEGAELAERLAKNLESMNKRTLDRGVSIYTGNFEGVPVSILSTDADGTTMDMIVKDLREILRGNIVIIGLGTCESIEKGGEVGNLAISTSSRLVTRNASALIDNKSQYYISGPSYPSKLLTKVLTDEISKLGYKLVETANASSDYFFSSRGTKRNERNQQLMGELEDHNVKTVETRTFYLFHFAELLTDPKKSVSTASLKIVTSKSDGDKILSDAKREELEERSGKICLKVLKEYSMD